MEGWPAYFSGLMGMLSGAGIIAVIVRGWREDLKTLRAKVETDQERRLARAEHNLQAVREACAPCHERVDRHERMLDAINPGLTNRDIERLSAQLDKIQANVDMLVKETVKALAEHKTRLDSLKEDTDRAHQKISAIRRKQGEFD